MSHPWYQLPVWRAIRRRQLNEHPLCEKCEARGITRAANTVDHHPPHEGVWERFVNGPFRSLCGSCHSGDARQEQRRGYSGAVGADGFPLDPAHPFNR